MTTDTISAYRSIADMLESGARRFGDAPAVIEGERITSHAALHAEARAMAKALLAAGIGPGDFVVCWAPNSTRWVVVAHATWMIGAVIMPLSTRLKAREVGPILEATSASLLLTVGECARAHLVDMLAAAYPRDPAGGFAGLPALREIVRLDLASAETAGEAGYDDFLARGAQVPDEQLDAAARRLTPATHAEVMFTSGSTGSPKGVTLDHGQLLRAYRDWADVAELREGDVYLVIPPFSHGFGLNAGILASAERGMAMVLLDIFDPVVALDLIRRHDIAVIAGPPNLFSSLLDERARSDTRIESLRVAFIGAANVPIDLLARVRGELGVRRAINAYGLIEGCVVSMTRASDPEIVISTTTGRPMDGVEVAIFDDAGRPLPDGETGEIVVRGYNVMAGYWRDPELTRAILSEEGWLHTGDIGLIEEHGCIRIVDRKKDMYVCGGFNVYPAEVENLLLSSGTLSAAAVVGVDDPRLGEVGVAYVVPLPGKTVTEAGLAAWARENMANYKAPRRIVINDALPLNANGKVAKDVLRKMAGDPAGGGEG